MGKELGEAAGNDWLPSAISVFAALSAFSAAAKNERERERERVNDGTGNCYVYVMCRYELVVYARCSRSAATVIEAVSVTVFDSVPMVPPVPVAYRAWRPEYRTAGRPC